MPRPSLTCLAAGIALALAGPSSAQDYSDPDWPCIQPRVEGLSPGLMWPVGEEQAPPQLDTATEEALTELAETLTLRRVDEAGMDAAIASFAADHRHDMAVMSEVFLRVFDALAARRSTIIAGIADYSRGQIDRAAEIDEARQQMDAEMAKEEPDFDRVDALEEQIDWSERIYTERQQSLRYVCETPVLLEQRLYTIARKLQAAAEE